MKTQIITAALVAALAASSAAAQEAVSESLSGSSSYSGVNIEGSPAARIAPSMGAPGVMHTAPCIIGHSVGVSVVGFGVSSGGGRLEENCNTREEAQFLFEVLRQPAGTARQAAIYHMCATDESLRATLVAMGACVVRSSNGG
jgi:hypothetical protein